MTASTRAIVSAALIAAPLLAFSTPAGAGVGDLLVAPTRIILDGGRGAEVVLNNIGDEPATYRVSVEFRRMEPDGSLEDVTNPTPADKAAADMIIYAPRRVTLAPHEPQAIRIAARPPQGLPDGEYRVHMLFRAIPPANPVVQPAAVTESKGLRFQLTPIYGVTIPVIVRLGNLQATAGIAGVHLDKAQDGAPTVALDLTRSGSRSTFGEIRVLKAGVKDPVALEKAVAVYTEIGTRHVSVPVADPDLETKSPAELATVARQLGIAGAPTMSKQDLIFAILRARAVGPVTVQYVESSDDGSHVIAETRTVLR
ncbi:MAG TPA: Rho termination factor N-terminal domain-containing protein [Sphingomicrobium sp.]|nr:Rho termination factor N-terminal domain-containing protein [Sphingomicrobium sp.]